MKVKKILIIEDDKSLISLIKEGFDSKSFEVKFALTANEGFKKALSDSPDLILLDILLPENNGFECLKNIKEHEKTSKIPVIILSNLGQNEEVRRGMELGAIDYMLKADVGIDEIVNKVDFYLK